MEKLIENQLESLSTQRELLIKRIEYVDSNSMNYMNEESKYVNQINIIDMRVDSLLDRLTK